MYLCTHLHSFIVYVQKLEHMYIVYTCVLDSAFVLINFALYLSNWYDPDSTPYSLYHNSTFVLSKLNSLLFLLPPKQQPVHTLERSLLDNTTVNAVCSAF